MGILHEEATWVDKIYRIQTADPITGGADGIVNIQPGQIANRTKYLYTVMRHEHTVTGHNILDEQVATDAAISESKIKFDVPLGNISSALDACADSLGALKSEVSNLIGPDGNKIEALSRALQLLWQSGITGFDWEFFSGILTMSLTRKYVVVESVKGDDTLLLDTTEDLSVGDSLLLYSAATPGRVEYVTVAKIFDGFNRILTTRPVTQSLTDGILAGTSWDTTDVPAKAHSGAVYLSHFSNALVNSPYGTFVINRDSGAGILDVEYRYEGENLWHKAVIEENRFQEDGSYEEVYSLNGGSRVQLRITNNNASVVNVNFMVLYSAIPMRQVRPIRKPVLLSPLSDVYRDSLVLSSSAFRTAYKDNLVRTEFQFQPDSVAKQTYLYAAEGDIELDVANDDAPVEGIYSVRCRQVSDMGDVSEWSDAYNVYVRDPKVFFSFQGAKLGTGFDDEQFYTLKHDIVNFGFDGSTESAGFGEALFTLDY